MATAPVIGARGRDVAYAVAVVTLFGTCAVFVYPFVGHALGLSDASFGLWSGTAINDTSQVVAASSAYSPGALEVATVVKLIRNALMAPLLLGIAWAWVRTETARADGPRGHRAPGLRRAVPLFVLGFLALAALRSIGVIGPELAAVLDTVARVCILVALAAVGLSVRVGELRLDRIAGAGRRVRGRRHHRCRDAGRDREAGPRGRPGGLGRRARAPASDGARRASPASASSSAALPVDIPNPTWRRTAAITPPTVVTARIISVGEQGEGEGLVARDAERRRDADRGQLERPDVARTGRDDRRQRDAARDEGGLAQRQLDADRLAGRDASCRSTPSRRPRSRRGRPRGRAAWPATARPSRRRRASSMTRGHCSAKRTDAVGAGQPVERHRERQAHDQQRHERGAQQDRAREDAAHAEDDDRQGGQSRRR